MASNAATLDEVSVAPTEAWRAPLASFEREREELCLATRYREEAGPGGVVIVRDVPIFGENVRELYGRTFRFDREWLLVAAAKDRKLRASGYSAPMHFGHHEPGVPRERAGKFSVKGLKLRYYENELRWLLFADLHFKSRDAFERMRREWPYRSVEVSLEKPDEVNSLALLSSEAPFFRFPDLNFGAGTSPATFVWRHRYTMADESEKDRAAGAGMPGAEAPNAGKPNAGLPPKAAAEPDRDASPSGKPGGLDQLGFQTAVMGMLQTMLAAIVKLAGAGAGDDAPEGIGTSPKHTPIVAASASTGAAPDGVAKLEGQVLALQAQLAKVEKERRDEAQFSTLKAELAVYGLPGLEVELRKKIAEGKADGWASGIKMVAPPSKRPSEAPPHEPLDAPEVAKYAEKGDATLLKARHLAAQYQAVPVGHLIRRNPLDRYLAANLEV